MYLVINTDTSLSICEGKTLVAGKCRFESYMTIFLYSFGEEEK